MIKKAVASSRATALILSLYGLSVMILYHIIISRRQLRISKLGQMSKDNLLQLIKNCRWKGETIKKAKQTVEKVENSSYIRAKTAMKGIEATLAKDRENEVLHRLLNGDSMGVIEKCMK